MLMNKAMGKRGLTLLTALMAVVLVVSGCGESGGPAPRRRIGFRSRTGIHRIRKSRLGSWTKKKRPPS